MRDRPAGEAVGHAAPHPATARQNPATPPRRDKADAGGDAAPAKEEPAAGPDTPATAAPAMPPATQPEPSRITFPGAAAPYSVATPQPSGEAGSTASEGDLGVVGTSSVAKRPPGDNGVAASSILQAGAAPQSGLATPGPAGDLISPQLACVQPAAVGAAAAATTMGPAVQAAGKAIGGLAACNGRQPAEASLKATTHGAPAGSDIEAAKGKPRATPEPPRQADPSAMASHQAVPVPSPPEPRTHPSMPEPTEVAGPGTGPSLPLPGAAIAGAIPLAAATAPNDPLPGLRSNAPPPTPAAQAVPSVIAVAMQAMPGGAPARLSVAINPLELGRLDIAVERAADGSARIHVLAERPETLQLLHRDAAILVAALDRAGFGGSAEQLSLGLTDPGLGRRPDGDGAGDQGRGQSGSGTDAGSRGRGGRGRGGPAPPFLPMGSARLARGLLDLAL